jgi:hypothetical protein
MTRHWGAQPEPTSAGQRRELFTLAGTLPHYEVTELSPKEAGELLAHLRRAGISDASLASKPQGGV